MWWVWNSSRIFIKRIQNQYIAKCSGQIFCNDKCVDIKPGSLHHNPMGKVHGINNTGNEPLVVLSIFSPTLKESDRHFLE